MDLTSLLWLNDKITAVVKQVEDVFKISVPRAVSKSAPANKASSKRRDRGFTYSSIDASVPLFGCWPGGMSSHGEEISTKDSEEDGKEADTEADDLMEYSDYDALSSVHGSWPARRDPGSSLDSSGTGPVPKVVMQRQGTRTQIALPSLHELMTNLRRGSAEDVARVADLIYYLFSDMAGYRRRSSSTSKVLQTGRLGLNMVHCKLIKNLVDQGGLLVLLQALGRCSEWPEVEIKVSRAVTVLMTCETDYYMLMRKANEILTAMNLLLLKGGVVLGVAGTENPGGTSNTPVADIDGCSSDSVHAIDLSSHHGGPKVHVDESLFQELVAMAVCNICALILAHWEKESVVGMDVFSGYSATDVSSKSESSDKAQRKRKDSSKSKPKTPDNLFLPPNALQIHRSQSGGMSSAMDSRGPSGGNSQNLTRCVESVLHIIATLIKPPSVGLAPGSTIGNHWLIFTKTAVLCCQAVCNLTQVSPLKQLVVEKRGRGEGILDLLVNWVNICTEEVSKSLEAAKDGPPIDCLNDLGIPSPFDATLENSNPLLFELIESVACAISSLCRVDRRPAVLSGQSDFDMPGTSEYAVGVIDAQMKAVSVPSAIIKFVMSMAPDVFADPVMGKSPMLAARRSADSSIATESLSQTSIVSVNDGEIVTDKKITVLLPYPIEIPSWCSIALMRSTAIHFAEALSSMTCRQTNRAPMITSALCTILVTAAAQTARHRRTRVNFEHPTEEYGPEKLQLMHQKQMEEDVYLGKIAAPCLNGLCAFVNDALNAASVLVPSTLPLRNQLREREAESLPEVVTEILSFNVLDTLKLVATLPAGEARLGAFRLLSIVSDWPAALEKMVDMSITEILVSFLKDVEDANECLVKSGTSVAPANSAALSTTGVPKPKKERGVSIETMKSGLSDDSPSAMNGLVPLPLEELMRVLYFISQVCEYSFQNAARLYDEGLMRVMLNLIKHYRTNAEVHRQALRSISAMCPVLSSITPGGHPAQVIEKLTSAKENAEMHMVQGSSPNVARRESAKTRLEFNLLIFVEALRALAHALLSPSSLVQKEALRGISLLAVDDQLRVGIVEGPLKQVIRIFVDPSTEQDIKDLAELVFVNIGFHNGSKDLEIVANDSDLLSDWFYMKRSMRPQALAYDLTRHWIDAIFYGDEMAERRARRHFMLAELGRSHDHISDEADSLSLHLPGGLAIDLRDTLDLPGLDVLKGMLEKLVTVHVSDDRQSSLYLGSGSGTTGGHSELRGALLQQFLFLFDSWQMLNHMYYTDHFGNDQHVPSNNSVLHSPYYDVLPAAGSRNKSSPSSNVLPAKKKKYGVSLFSNTFFKYISHCSSRMAAQKMLDEEENERMERELEAERLLMGPLSAITSDIAFNTSYHGVRSGSGNKNQEVRPIRKKPANLPAPLMDGNEPLRALHDELAGRVVELLDYIFPSKMFQFYLCDLVSCGSSQLSGDDNFNTPQPHQFRALLLPPREYLSFHREGRIIERIFDDIKTKGFKSEKPTFDYTANVLSFGTDDGSTGVSDGNVNKNANSLNDICSPPAVLWAMSFRDAKFEGEFYATFSNTLHKCPSISAINFVMQTPTLDSRLGYLAGNIPPTVHFLTFENALSSDSLQIMCVLLRTQNAAWNQSGNVDSSIRSKSYVQTRGRRDSNATAGRGLFGLAIRLHNLSDEDVKHIIELLDPLGQSSQSMQAIDLSIYKSPAQRNALLSSPIQTVTATLLDENGEAGGHIPVIPTNKADSCPNNLNPRGLKYLDLSDNRLSDAQCGDVLKAGAFGPLEVLELGGNLIQRGLYFCDSLQYVLSRPSSTLKHIGVSYCGLSSKCFAKMLTTVAHTRCDSLTSLDASSNSLIHSPEVKESILELLKKNRAIRMIDLSNNNFNNDTIRAINLGLLENESTVLLIKISVNASMKAQDLSYVREKLWHNRELYSRQRSSAASGGMRHVSVDISQPDRANGDFNVEYMRERHIMDSSDAITHAMSANAALPGTALSRETSTSSMTASATGAESMIPSLRRSSSDAIVVMSTPVSSRISSKDSNLGSADGFYTSVLQKMSPKPPSDPSLSRSLSNPFITVSDTGRRRSGTGVCSSQEAMDAVSRFSEDGTRLNIDLGGIAFKRSSSDKARECNLDQSSPGEVETVYVENAYPVSFVSAVAAAEEAVVLGVDNATEVDMRDGTMLERKDVDDELNKSTRSMHSDTGLPEGISRELWVLFSAPLAWRDAESGVLKPIEILNYKNEKDTLWQVFREGQRDIDLHFNFATTDQLRTAVTLGCKALHFSGHGHPDWLNFEDGKSGLQIVTVERLEKLCSAGGIKLDFVFVSACYSRKAGEAFAAAGVKHVVCVSVDAQLLDTAATIFTRAFYLALVVGETVDKAFEIGQNAVAASPSVPSSMKEHDKFLLLPQDKPHNVPIFKAPILPRWPPEHSAAMRWEERLTPDYLPEPPEDFEGREVDMYEVITALHKRHLVTIIGERGVGKSAVAVAAMRYITERNVFENGAVYVRLQHVSTYEGFLTTFQRILTSTCSAAAVKLRQLSASMRVDDRISSGDVSSNRYKKDPLFTQEDLLISCVSSLKLLIVFDHANNLLTAGEVGSDVTMFLGNLLEGRRNIRVLMTSTVGVGIISGFGIVEKCIKIGPLTLYNSLRLFARLTPALVTAKQRYKFIQSLTPRPVQGSIGDNSSANIDYLPESKNILGLLGNGHPDKIVKLAVESDAESVIALQTTGMNLIASAAEFRRPVDHSLSSSTRSVPPSGDLTIPVTPSAATSGSTPRSGLSIPLFVGPAASAASRPELPSSRLISSPSLQAERPIRTPMSFPSPLSQNVTKSNSNGLMSTPLVAPMSPLSVFILPPPGPSAGAIDPFEYYENDVTPVINTMVSQSDVQAVPAENTEQKSIAGSIDESSY